MNSFLSSAVSVVCVAWLLIGLAPSCNQDNSTPNPAPIDNPQEQRSIVGTTWELVQAKEGLTRTHRYHFLKEHEVRYWVVDFANGTNATTEDNVFYYFYRDDKNAYFVEHKGEAETVTYKLKVDWAKKLMFLDDSSGEPDLVFHLVE